MKYKKKPIVIEAFQWTGGLEQIEDPEWIVSEMKSGRIQVHEHSIHPCVMKIQTLEGELQAKPGDYIIRGIKGEIYPCKADIFDLTYENVIENEIEARKHPYDGKICSNEYCRCQQ